ncbi:MAG: M48 family metallopeptidase [Bacteriovoracaceae bacterium]|nr:M48 family metallopeptidase [Bacteriovoracaceae bacterium]
MKKIVLKSFLLMALVSCTTAPISGQKSLILTSEKDEVSMGEQAFQEILKKEKKSTNAAQVAQIDQIAKRLVAVAGRPDYKWEMVTLENPAPNAFCLPGGKMATYTGILKYAENESALAAVVGHEIGHALARHGGQRISQNILLTGALVGAGATALSQNKNKDMIMAGLGVVATTAIVLPFSRSNESEADEIGLVLMARAGYDPREAPLFWDRMGKAGGGKAPPEFLSTHPASSTRKKHLEELLPNAIEIYNRAPQKYGKGDKLIY